MSAASSGPWLSGLDSLRELDASYASREANLREENEVKRLRALRRLGSVSSSSSRPQLAATDAARSSASLAPIAVAAMAASRAHVARQQRVSLGSSASGAQAASAPSKSPASPVRRVAAPGQVPEPWRFLPLPSQSALRAGIDDGQAGRFVDETTLGGGLDADPGDPSAVEEGAAASLQSLRRVAGYGSDGTPLPLEEAAALAARMVAAIPPDQVPSPRLVTGKELERRVTSLMGSAQKAAAEDELEAWTRSHRLRVPSRFTRAELRQLRVWFQYMDSDGSGQIDVSELEDPMLSTGVIRNHRELEAVLRVVDTDGDGEMSFEEFVQTLLMARRFEMKQQAAAEAAAAAAAAMALPSQNQASTRGASPLHRRTSVGSGGPPLSLATSASIARVEPERAALLRDVQNLELLVDLCETAPSLRHDEAAAIAAHGPSGVTTGPVADLLRRRLSAGRGVGVAALSELQRVLVSTGAGQEVGAAARMDVWDFWQRRRDRQSRAKHRIATRRSEKLREELRSWHEEAIESKQQQQHQQMQPLLAASAAPPASHDISAEQSQTQGSGDDSSRGPEEPVDRFAHRSRPWRRRGAPPSLTASASAPSLAATEAAPTPVDVLASTIGGAAAVPQLLTITADAIAAEAPRAALRALPPDAEEVAAAEDAARASVSLGLPLRLAEHRRKFLLGAMLESRRVDMFITDKCQELRERAYRLRAQDLLAQVRHIKQEHGQKHDLRVELRGERLSSLKVVVKRSMTLESRPATSAQFRWARATLIAQATGGPVGQAARPLATRSPLVTQPAAQAALLRSGGDLSSLSPETPVGSPSTGRTGRSTTSRSRQGRRPRRRRRQQAGDRIGSDGEATGDEETPGQQWSGQEDGDEVDDDGDLTAGAAHRGDSDQAPPFAISEQSLLSDLKLLRNLAETGGRTSARSSLAAYVRSVELAEAQSQASHSSRRLSTSATDPRSPHEGVTHALLERADAEAERQPGATLRPPLASSWSQQRPVSRLTAVSADQLALLSARSGLSITARSNEPTTQRDEAAAAGSVSISGDDGSAGNQSSLTSPLGSGSMSLSLSLSLTGSQLEAVGSPPPSSSSAATAASVGMSLLRPTARSTMMRSGQRSPVTPGANEAGPPAVVISRARLPPVAALRLPLPLGGGGVRVPPSAAIAASVTDHYQEAASSGPQTRLLASGRAVLGPSSHPGTPSPAMAALLQGALHSSLSSSSSSLSSSAPTGIRQSGPPSTAAAAAAPSPVSSSAVVRIGRRERDHIRDLAATTATTAAAAAAPSSTSIALSQVQSQARGMSFVPLSSGEQAARSAAIRSAALRDAGSFSLM